MRAFFITDTQNAVMVGVRRLLKLLTCFLSMASTLPRATGVSYDMEWRVGRATYYGGPWDGASIHKGACNFGYLYKDEPHGWDVTAMNDGNPMYDDSCGQCVEVMCDPRWIPDNYGASLDRTSACTDSKTSLVVRITDVCPCTYAANSYSNRRWCCNDVEHLDLSIWAFEKLASETEGVIGLKYRAVPCSHTPTQPSHSIEHPTPGVDTPRGDVRKIRDWPDMSSNRADPLCVYRNGFENGFGDASWAASAQSTSHKGLLNGDGLCASISQGGALAVSAPSGPFTGRVGVKFFLYVGQDGRKPDINVGLSGPKGGCSSVRIYDVQPMYFVPASIPYSSDYFWGWQMYFPDFASGPSDSLINDPNCFKGCGGNGPYDLNTVTFRNDVSMTAQWLCVDHIEII